MPLILKRSDFKSAPRFSFLLEIFDWFQSDVYGYFFSWLFSLESIESLPFRISVSILVSLFSNALLSGYWIYHPVGQSGDQSIQIVTRPWHLCGWAHRLVQDGMLGNVFHSTWVWEAFRYPSPVMAGPLAYAPACPLRSPSLISDHVLPLPTTPGSASSRGDQCK